MKNLKALALTALAATTLGFAAPKAEAYSRNGCTPVYAVRIMNDALAGGASLDTAWQWAIDDGQAVATKRCWTMVSGYGRGLRYTFPFFWNAAWGN